MGNRRFEMYEYRAVLVRMREGDSDREISRLGLMGRAKAGEFRAVADSQGWLDVERSLPSDEALFAHVGRASRSSTLPTSKVEPHRDEVTSWLEAGIDGTTIHQTLIELSGLRPRTFPMRRFLLIS